MVSKNNRVQRMEQVAEREPHFGIRKLTVGAASVLLGTTLWLGNNATVANADIMNDKEADQAQEDSTHEARTDTKDTNQVIVEKSNENKVATANKSTSDQTKNASAEEGVSVEEKTETTLPAAKENQSIQNDQPKANTAEKTPATEKAEVAKKIEASKDKNVVDSNNTKKAQQATDLHIANATKNTKQKQAEQASQENAAKKSAKEINTAAQNGKKADADTVSQDLNKAAQAGKATDTAQTDLSQDGVTTNQNNLNQAGKVIADSTDEKNNQTQELKIDDLKPGLSEDELKANITKGNEALIDRSTISALSKQVKDIDPSKELAANKMAMLGLNLMAMPNTTGSNDADAVTVNDWNSFQSALTSGKQINVEGNITANGNVNIMGNVTINGKNGSSLNLGQYTITNNSNLTLKDLTVNGSILGGGTINIQGNVTSNVGAGSSKPTNNEYKAQDYKGNINSYANSNIGARQVNVEDGASLTINSSEINDGINLRDGGGVNVGANATLNINLNNNSNTITRYHTAGIFSNGNANFTTGRNAVVNLNTGIGQGIAIGVGRPVATDKDRFDGYGTAQSRPNGAGQINLGQYSKFNFTGRDGIILGNNSNFNVGQYANVHFENQGRGVALDLANNSNININDHAVTFFHSVGKTGVSGSYDGYNYIGVNEAGNITIGEDATFRVILQGRGDNPWDDVVQLDSRKSSTTAAFTSKKGAIVDIRDDNTNFYAELISFPLGNSHSRINIEDPLLLNLQRYSAGGATTGWMAGVGGTDINTTSSKYTANLIYMSASNGVLTIGGTDYVVYQQIKSNGAQQIWTDVNSVEFDKTGFASKNVYDNGANPDLSINGQGLVGGIRANQIRDNQTSPTAPGRNTPAYGISTMRASHQIWIPHETSTQLKGTHTNTIKYVYEDGSPVLNANGQPIVVKQDLNLTRNLTLDLTPDQIKTVQDYALNHTADETLHYIRSGYSVTKDSGWKYTNDAGQPVTNPYAEVTSPVEKGYTATIQSTNAPGVTVGANGDKVKANFEMNASQDPVQNGQLTAAYREHGIIGLPEDYVTVVVYKKAAEKGSLTVNYFDDTTKTEIPNTQYKTGSLDAGSPVTYTTKPTIDELEKKGYVYVNTDGTIPKNIEGNQNVVVTVHMKHGQIPVGPDTPEKHGVDPNELTKNVNETVHYVYSDGKKAHDDNIQTSKWTRTVTVDAVTNAIIPDGQYTTSWAIPDNEKKTYDQVISPIIKGYYADQADIPATAVTQDNIEKTVTYKPIGHIIPVDPSGNPIPDAPTPQFPNDPNDPTKSTPGEKPNVPGYHPQTGKPGEPVPPVPNNPGEDVKVPYVKDEGAVQVIFHDDTDNVNIPNVGYSSGDAPAGTKITYTPAQNISELEKKGYVYVNTDGTIPPEVEANKDIIVTVHMKHGVQPITPDTPTPDVPKNTPAEAQPDQLKKEVTLTVNYVNSDGTKFTGTIPANAHQTATFIGTAYVDKVTGKLVNAVEQDGKWVIDENNHATPKIVWTSDKTSFTKVVSPVENDYHLVSISDHKDGNDVGAITGLTKDTKDITVTVTYSPNGKIIPVDPSGKPIPDAPTPQYPTDPQDPSKVIPNEPVPDVPGMTPETPTVTPTDPGKDTPVVYTKPNPEDETVNSKQTVHYIDGDTNTKLRDDTVDGKFTFIKSGKDGKWNEDSHKFENVNAPVIDGYVSEKKTYEGQTATPIDPDKEITIIYHKVGKIIPVDPSGKPIPDAPTPSYKNDPNDPTKVTPDEPTPDVPGWTTNIPKVTPEVPTKDTDVSYTKPTPAPEDQTVTVKYFDDTTGPSKQNLSSYDKTIVAKPGADLNYSAQPTITELENKGFKLVSDNFNVTKMPEHGGNYEIHFIHNTTTITPNNPGKPGEPINPNDPDGPKWPDGTDSKSLTKQGLQTVHYNYADGKKAYDDNVQTTQFDHILVFDNVTGKEIEDKGWSPTSHKFNNVTSPTIDGYHPNKKVVEGATVTPDDPISETTVVYAKNGEEIKNQEEKDASQIVKYVDEAGKELHASASQKFTFTYSGNTYDQETGRQISTGKWNATSHEFTAENVPVIDGYVAVSGYTNNDGKYTAGGFTAINTASDQDRNRVFTVVYKKVGKIVPVGPDGETPIPDAPTPTYPNDPNNPTKVTPNEPVPDVPGYTPTTPTVTPSVPTEDTPVIYNPQIPAQVEKAQVQYIDLDDNNKVMSESPVLTGKAGAKIDYSTASEIAKYEKEGYVLANDGFSDNPVFDNIDGNMQIFKVTFRHGQIPVNPDHPHDGVDPSEYTKNVKETVHYVGAGNETPADNVQTSKWTRTITIDAVTNKVIPDGQYTTDWSIPKGDKTVYNQVNTPVVENYHADKANVPATAVTQDNIEVTITYTPNGKIIPVNPNGKPIPNAPTPQYPTDPKDPTKVVPDEPVPNIPGYKPSTPTITPTNPGKDTPVPYSPETPAKDQAAVVNYVDADENNKLITSSGILTGKAGTKIDYSTKPTITELENKGYVLVNNGFPQGATYDSDDNTTQVYTVVMRHGTTPVSPENPGKPGQPINPNDPNGPKYPEDSNDVTKNVTRTVKYVDQNGKEVSTPVEQTVHFTASGVLDNVTGKWITPLTWSPAQTVSSVKTPVVDGYHVVSVSRDQDGVNVKAVTLTYNDSNYTVTVTYAPNGRIIPVDPSGKPIPDAPTPQFPTNPSNPGQTNPGTKPNVPGYKPETGKPGDPVDPDPADPGKDVTVPYVPDIMQATGKVTYIDDTTGKILQTVDLKGNVGEKITYTTQSTIKSYENKGYDLVSNNFRDGDETFAKTGNDFQVHFKHGLIPVTPENPGKPGQPINPDDPNGPKWPEGTGENGVKRTGSQTIHYTGAGDKTPKDNVQHFTFTKKMIVDKVTGEIVDSGSWNVTSHTFGSVDTPVIDGYHADKRTAGGQTITPDNLNKTVTVNYTSNGKIIPVDPSGKPIPGAPTPQYPTDPTDPTKVVPDEPVPNVPGYKPSTPTVTPTNPGKDTPVPYVPDVVQAIGKVTYIDDTTGKILQTVDLKGNVGEKITYTTQPTITKYENKGYKLVSSNFKDGDETFAKTGNDFQVHFEHALVPVNPTNPGKPGQPINPNDPNGPKWPDGTGEDSLKKMGKQTIHYTGAGDNTPKDNVSTTEFSHEVVVDKVTGKIVKDNGWTPKSHTFNTVDTPVVDGYHANKKTAGGNTVTVEKPKVTDVVNYTQNGKIIPVDPNGQPIPGAPTPQYPTDPKDPTKVVPNEPVPSIPEMTPETSTVTPQDPGKDTPVVYKPNVTPTPTPDVVTTIEGKQTITFIDGDNGNTPLRDPNVQTYPFTVINGVPTESSHTFTTINVPVIDGYVSEVKTAGGKTVTPENPDANVIVVYHKIGKIVPVNPDGTPIPGVPTPNYQNDPDDPTKVIPNEPVPEISGYTPNQNTVTPTDPTKDTQVVYNKPETPTMPETVKPHGQDEAEPTPTKPKIPANEGVKIPNIHSEVVPPHATKVEEPKETVKPHANKPVQTKPVVKSGKVVEKQAPAKKQTAKTLPQTGEGNNETAGVIGGLAAGLGLIGLAGVKKRKKDKE